MDVLIWIGFSQSLFAAILMLAKKGLSLPDRILSGWLVLLAIEFLICALNYEIFGNPVYSGSFLIFNPALFIYIRSLTMPKFRLRWVQLLHLLPFIIIQVYIYFIGESFPDDTFISFNEEHLAFKIIYAITNILSWSIYNLYSIYLITRYRKMLQKEVSNIEKNESLWWILVLSIFYISYCCSVFILAVISPFSAISLSDLHLVIYITLLILIYILSFYGLHQTAVHQSEEEDSGSYKNSTLSIEVKQEIKNRITSYVEKEKAYLLPDLKMDYLSKALNIPKYQITEVLNTEVGKNFFQFVNSYRVEAVKQMLSNPQLKYSIEAIGYECGFSSKSSFYTVFKKMTGTTPINYRKRLNL